MTPTAVSTDPILDRTAAVRQIMELVDLAAAQRATVVVTGASEAGPEIVARAIHIRGDGAGAPFLRLDCSRVRAHDVGRELFGVAIRGSATDPPNGGTLQTLTRASRLLQASGGTLFLQHAERMSPAVQGRLTQVLSQGEASLEPGRERVPVNVRLVIAADPQFDRACEDGRIDPDLHGLSSAVRITLPELGTRPDEIPSLASHLLDDLCKDANVPGKELTSLAQILLTAMVRRRTALEVRFLLEGLVMRVRDRVIRVEDLVANLFVDDLMGPMGTGISLHDAREQFERKYIVAVLERHHGRIPHAARALGIQRANLYRKLRHLDVSPADLRSRPASRRRSERRTSN